MVGKFRAPSFYLLFVSADLVHDRGIWRSRRQIIQPIDFRDLRHFRLSDLAGGAARGIFSIPVTEYNLGLVAILSH